MKLFPFNMKFLPVKNGFKRSEMIILGLLAFTALNLIVITIVANRYTKLLATSSEEVRHTQEIKFDVEQILSTSTDLETGARGYVITGNEHYTEPTNKAIGSIFEHLHHLEDMEEGNPVQLARITQLTDLIDMNVTNSTRAIEIRKNKGLDSAIAYVSNGNGKDLMDRIRVITDRMMSDENQNLRARTEIDKANFQNLAFTFRLLAFTVVVIAIYMFFVMRYYFDLRRLSERMLKENKHLLQEIIDNTSSIISVKDLAGRYVMVNSSYEEIFHVKKKDVEGKTDYDLFNKEIAEATRKTDLDVITNKKPIHFEEVFPVQDTKHYFLSVKFPLYDKNNFLYSICTSANDITEKKRIDEMEKNRSMEIMDLFNNAPCGYLSTDVKGMVIEMNDTMLKWLGREREDIVGKVLTKDIMSEDSLPIFEYYYPRLRSGEMKGVHDLEVRYRRKDGSIFPAMVNSIGIYDANGNFVKTRTSIFDLTVMKKAESLFMQN